MPPHIVSASGLMMRAADGREYIDGCGTGGAVSGIGHGNVRVRDAIVEQLDRVAYAHTSFFTSGPAEELADLLVGHAPGGLTHALFVSGGAEANEAAIKLTRQYFLEIGQPQRTRFIARRQGFHGNTLGALGASSGIPGGPYQALLSDNFSHVSAAFAYHNQQPGESEAEFTQRLVDELEAEFQRLGPQNVAAFWAETVGGATVGAVTAPAGYFKGVREVCDRHGALLILDEVMCGMGRTGTLHAWEQEGISPDIQPIAKGLGGGYLPVAAILIGDRIFAALRAGSGAFKHGHTYSGHPVACAAALAVQRVIVEDDLLANVKGMGAHLDNRLTDRFGNHAHVGDVRGRGLFMAVEFVRDRGAKVPFEPGLKLHARIRAEALERGLLCYAIGGTFDGKAGDHILLAPAYIATSGDIDRIVDILGESADAALDGIAT
jgi:adenosylmethionine-8-amino-7-oxononanoate aminotransferase